MYNQKVMQHFLKPCNQGKIKSPDGVGEAGNPICGDIMKMYIKVKKQGAKKIISAIKFETLGCAMAIANSSALTKMVKGMEIKKALKITHNDIIKKELGGDVPKIKIHCSFLAREALKNAVKNYEQKNKANKKSKKS